MSQTKVKAYKTKELLERVKSLPSFKGIPKGYWLLAVRSNESYTEEQEFYDDKFYIFKDSKFVMVTTGTTNSGSYGLLNWFKFNKNGTAVIKSEEWYYDVYQKSDGKTVRHHSGKGQCGRQISDMLYYRDKTGDGKIDEESKVYKSNSSTNLHTNNYNSKTGIDWKIFSWSVGCCVINNRDDFYKFMDMLGEREIFSLCMIKEF